MRTLAVLARLLPTLAALVWSGSLLLDALRRWRFERVCEMTCGPFWEPELIGPLRTQMDWHTPLVLAFLPILLLVGLRVWRRARGG